MKFPLCLSTHSVSVLDWDVGIKTKRGKYWNFMLGRDFIKASMDRRNIFSSWSLFHSIFRRENGFKIKMWTYMNSCRFVLGMNFHFPANFSLAMFMCLFKRSQRTRTLRTLIALIDRKNDYQSQVTLHIHVDIVLKVYQWKSKKNLCRWCWKEWELYSSCEGKHEY